MIIAIFIVSMLVGLAIGLPIAIALIFCSVATALFMGSRCESGNYRRWLMNGVDQQTMMALPFFIMAGEIMNRGGLTKRIIALANVFVGRVRGGLGYVTILACLMFASMVGSAVAACAALGSILIPMMADSGYSRPRSAALVASSNLVAPIMPPSVPLIVFGIACANSGLFKNNPVSIKSLFMGGIAPAIYLTLVTAVVWFIVSRKEHNVNYDVPRHTFKEVVNIIGSSIWALMLPVIILVGLRAGLVTATEAGVVACVYALIIGLFVYRELKIKDLIEALVSSAKMSAVIMFLAAAAGVAAYYMMISEYGNAYIQPPRAGRKPDPTHGCNDVGGTCGRTGNGRYPQHPDFDSHYASFSRCGRDKSHLFRGSVCHDERTWTYQPARGTDPKRGMRHRKDKNGSDHRPNHAVLYSPDGAVFPAGYIPAADRSAINVAWRLT